MERMIIKSNIFSGGLKKPLFMTGLILALILVMIFGMIWGAVSIGWRNIFAILLDMLPFYESETAAEVAVVYRDILLQIRIPRVLLAAAVGSSLAVSGAVFQGLFRNPMADPYVIGISSGAALGAVFAMLSGFSLTIGGFGAVPLFAFFGGIATITLVYSMARVGRAVPVMTLLLAGIAVSAFLSAIVSLLTYFAGEKLHMVVFWMMGGLGGATWQQVKIMLPYAMVGYICVSIFSRELNAMLLGEETAGNLGVDTEKVKKILLAGASLLVAAAVSTSGIIGFVGLVVPHFIRLVAGPDHRFLLPASAILGATLLIATDMLARVIIAPTELPVGIITAMIGAPMFIYLLKKRRKLRYFGGGG
ncbi:MAG: iron chelate uptake ABC transporter family permease subunit [Firmicutes bacterium]|nr:iron chelate uptake ABC transporter family permease subunit [Bacillota bacterium]